MIAKKFAIYQFHSDDCYSRLRCAFGVSADKLSMEMLCSDLNKVADKHNLPFSFVVDEV